MTRLKRMLNVSLILIICVGFDQVTKAIAKTYLPRDQALTFGGDTLRLHYAENSGAFLSLGASLPLPWRTLLFTVGMAAIVVIVLAYLLRAASLTPSHVLALSLIASGGLGNLIDRVAYGGYVIDFLNLGVGGLRTGIFNVADMAITTGVALLFFSRPQSESQTAENEDQAIGD